MKSKKIFSLLLMGCLLWSSSPLKANAEVNDYRQYQGSDYLYTSWGGGYTQGFGGGTSHAGNYGSLDGNGGNTSNCVLTSDGRCWSAVYRKIDTGRIINKNEIESIEYRPYTANYATRLYVADNDGVFKSTGVSINTNSAPVFIKGADLPVENLRYFSCEADSLTDGVQVLIHMKTDNVAPTINITQNIVQWTKGVVTLTAKASDNSGIKRIKLPDGNYMNGDTANYTVGDNGSYTFIAEDNFGNQSNQSINVSNIDKTNPTITEAHIENNNKDGYDIVVTGVSDSQSGIDRVQFPTWTEANGQDDIDRNWANSDISKGQDLGNGSWKYHVSKSAHNNESGKYITHVYVYDKAGNGQCVTSNVIANTLTPSITKVENKGNSAQVYWGVDMVQSNAFAKISFEPTDSIKWYPSAWNNKSGEQTVKSGIGINGSSALEVLSTRHGKGNWYNNPPDTQSDVSITPFDTVYNVPNGTRISVTAKAKVEGKATIGFIADGSWSKTKYDELSNVYLTKPFNLTDDWMYLSDTSNIKVKEWNGLFLTPNAGGEVGIQLYVYEKTADAIKVHKHWTLQNTIYANAGTKLIQRYWGGSARFADTVAENLNDWTSISVNGITDGTKFNGQYVYDLMNQGLKPYIYSVVEDNSKLIVDDITFGYATKVNLYRNGAKLPLNEDESYLSQYEDKQAKDTTSPEQIKNLSIKNDASGIKLTWNQNDLGNNYTYNVSTVDEVTKLESGLSESKSINVISGIKEYRIFDGSTLLCTSKNSEISLDKNTNLKNVKIVAIDNAGNETTSLLSSVDNTPPSLTLTPNNTSLTDGQVVINALASDSDSDVKRIQLPDGNWVYGNSANFTVSNSGTYSFIAEDNMGNQITKTIDVSNIVKKPTLKATPVPSGNYIKLDWSVNDNWQSYNYILHSKKTGDTEFQTIPSKSNVKVLNIYPGVGNNLKTWMEINGYGKGLIKVDEVNIDDFNTNPDVYLKDANGKYKYDAIYEGAWNVNNGKDLSNIGLDAIKKFISEGRGYLCGHDALLSDVTAVYPTQINRNKLAIYMNMILKSYFDSDSIGSPSVKLTKKGLLTNYPWVIGDVGTKLTVPFSHSSQQYPSGDIWIRYDGFNNVLNNFYLETWNNTAMIQTGHSSGEATPDEQKILANTLFYLAQVTNGTTWDDHKGQDLDAPDKPTIKSVSVDGINNKVNVNYSEVEDKGTTYQYYVDAQGEKSGAKTTSDIVESTIKTGLKGYSIVVDTNPNTIPDSTIETTNTNLSIDRNVKENFYVHVASVDNVDNISEVSHYKFEDKTAPELTLTSSTTAWSNKDLTITAIAKDSESGVKSIKLPDGTYINGAEAKFSVNKNGIYEFEVTDNVGNKTIKSITISNVDEEAPVVNIISNPPQGQWSKDNVTLRIQTTDSGLGVSYIKLPNGNLSYSDTFDYLVTDNGTYNFTVVDKAGNLTTKSFTVSNIDKELPTAPAITTNQNWTNAQQVPVTITAGTDAQSGVKGIQYKLDGSTQTGWLVYKGVFNITTEGITTITARTVDNVGQYSTESIEQVKIDRSAPIDNDITISPIKK